MVMQWTNDEVTVQLAAACTANMIVDLTVPGATVSSTVAAEFVSSPLTTFTAACGWGLTQGCAAVKQAACPCGRLTLASGCAGGCKTCGGGIGGGDASAA